MQEYRPVKRTPEQAEEEILAYFTRWHYRPVLIGQIALELKIALSDAERYLWGLVTKGIIRELSLEEAKKRGITYGYVKA